MPAKEEDSPLRESDCHWLEATRALPHWIAPKVRTKNSARCFEGWPAGLCRLGGADFSLAEDEEREPELRLVDYFENQSRWGIQMRSELLLHGRDYFFLNFKGGCVLVVLL